jgi:1-acyl-sn-glycerol-3-phosphate acyltransferase
VPDAFLYRVLRPLARLLARLFHRRLLVENAGRVPATGPVVLAANHPNMLLDVLLLGASTKRTLHFLGKATLFRNPFLGGALKLCGVLPVHRRKESPDRMEENLETFAACHRLLAEGGAIAIFPEGVSHDRDAILPLRTGCARIVLEAESKAGFRLSSAIVPVGISFSNRELFRSDALLVFGETIDPAIHFDAYQRDPAAAVKGLTADLEAALRKLAPHVPLEDDEALVRILRGFFAGDTTPSSERLTLDRTLVQAIAYFRDRHPLDYGRLRRRLLAYSRILDLLGLPDGNLDRSYRLGSIVRYLAPRLLLAAAGFPVFVAGVAFHYVPYRVPAVTARFLAGDPVEKATTKLLAGIVSFPLFYALAIFLTGWPLLLPLMPPLGLFALVYAEAVGELLGEIRIFLRRNRLKPFRDALAAELETRRREFEALENTLSG